jgi:hypothetical protein
MLIASSIARCQTMRSRKEREGIGDSVEQGRTGKGSEEQWGELSLLLTAFYCFLFLTASSCLTLEVAHEIDLLRLRQFFKETKRCRN